MINTWEKLVDVNNQELNDQHQNVTSLFCQLQEAVAYHKFSKDVAKILTELLNYTDYHFKTEEAYLKKISYPELASHVEEHQEFKQQLLQLQNDFKNNQLKSSLELVNHLKSWILTHVAGSDKKYADFISQKSKTKI